MARAKAAANLKSEDRSMGEFSNQPRRLGAGGWIILNYPSHQERIENLPSNLYTHSILNVVYQTYEKIEHKYGSILNFTIEEIVAQLIQQGLAPQTARSCADLFDEFEWHNAQLPLRQWLGSIRDFYHKKP